MNFDRAHTVAFTGHRSYSEEAKSELEITIKSLYDRGFRQFMSGMAAGFDMSAAEAVLSLKQRCADVRLVAVVPFTDHAKRFSGELKEQYDAIIASSDEVVVVSDDYSAWCYHLRNDFLVDNSSYVVAYYDGSNGGTRYTVKRAHSKHIPVENLYPDPQLNFFKL